MNEKLNCRVVITRRGTNYRKEHRLTLTRAEALFTRLLTNLESMRREDATWTKGYSVYILQDEARGSKTLKQRGF